MHQVKMTVPAEDVFHFVRLLELEGKHQADNAAECEPGICQDEYNEHAEAVEALMRQVAELTPGDSLTLTATGQAERLMLTTAADAMVAAVAEAPAEVGVTDYAGLEAAADRLRDWAKRARLVNLEYEAAEAVEKAGV
jgi:hypothetical protein